MLSDRDLACLVCPRCPNGPDGANGALTFQGQDAVRCGDCGRLWWSRHGLLSLLEEQSVSGTDRLMRYIYDSFAPLHDPAVRYLLPALQLGGTEHSLREGYIPRLELTQLSGKEKVRILEVSVGAGANLPLIERALPKGVQAEIWGVDLSLGMVLQCQRRLAQSTILEVKLLLADAHALPFSDGFFDRVFHVGGIGGFRSPATALLEMARVAKPGTPIVVVDEQLDPSKKNRLYHRLGFRAITFYDEAPAAPVQDLPEGAIDVQEAQVSRFYYCLSFRMPQLGGSRGA